MTSHLRPHPPPGCFCTRTTVEVRQRIYSCALAQARTCGEALNSNSRIGNGPLMVQQRLDHPGRSKCSGTALQRTSTDECASSRSSSERANCVLLPHHPITCPPSTVFARAGFSQLVKQANTLWGATSSASLARSGGSAPKVRRSFLKYVGLFQLKRRSYRSLSARNAPKQMVSS